MFHNIVPHSSMDTYSMSFLSFPEPRKILSGRHFWQSQTLGMMSFLSEADLNSSLSMAKRILSPWSRTEERERCSALMADNKPIVLCFRANRVTLMKCSWIFLVMFRYGKYLGKITPSFSQDISSWSISISVRNRWAIINFIASLKVLKISLKFW